MKRQFLSLLLLVTSCTCLAQPEQPIQESPEATESLGYTSVAEALAALKTKPGVNVNVTKPEGWIIVNEPAPEFAVWSFTPEAHYAYPAVVRRQVKQDARGEVSLQMTALCEAEKQPCDRLMREFEQLNERMRENLRARMNQGKGRQ